MKEEEAKIWKQGYEDGIKASQRMDGKAIRIGNAILDVLYEIFELKDEDL